MSSNISRIGVSLQCVGMAWCQCSKKGDLYIIEEFQEMATSFTNLKKATGLKLPLYTNQQKIIKNQLDEVGLIFKPIESTREEVEPLIASVINEGKLMIEKNSESLFKRVISEDYLIRDRETPAAEALHFGLGELIFETSKPRSVSCWRGLPLKTLKFTDLN